MWAQQICNASKHNVYIRYTVHPITINTSYSTMQVRRQHETFQPPGSKRTCLNVDIRGICVGIVDGYNDKWHGSGMQEQRGVFGLDFLSAMALVYVIM